MKTIKPATAVPPTPEAIIRLKLNDLYPIGWVWRDRLVNASNRNKPTVYGVGINDADYVVAIKVNGKEVKCPIYRTWVSMLKRAYDPKYHERKPTYTDCSVAPEWYRFSNFRAWMVIQDWRGKQLDKDLLIPGNKHYSANNCIFVTGAINALMTDHAAARGNWPIGVYFDKGRDKFVAQCSNPFGSNRIHLGLFDHPEQASIAYLKFKSSCIFGLAASTNEERLRNALYRIAYNTSQQIPENHRPRLPIPTHCKTATSE